MEGGGELDPLPACQAVTYTVTGTGKFTEIYVSSIELQVPRRD